MNQDRWDNIISIVKEKFSPAELSSEDIEIGEDAHNNPVKGKIEKLEFTGPLGKMKLERTTKPRVIDKQTLHSNRAGSDVRVNYIYSDDEVTQFMKAYKWNEDEEEWTEIEAGNLVAQ